MEKSILATLSYADIFSYPLTTQEIFLWLIDASSGKYPKISQTKFQLNLESLIKKKQVVKKGDYYCLPGREEIFEIRAKRLVWSSQKKEKVQKIVFLLKMIPWVKLVGITGALARNNATQDDDIDLFLITANKRLWLTRGVVVLLLALLGVYRRPGRTNNMICPNMFIDETSLKMSPHDVFIAHEVCLMEPLFQRENTYFNFLKTNSWINQFLPKIYESKLTNCTMQVAKIKSKKLSFFNLDTVEELSRSLQLWYMRKKRTKETIEKNVIKFHPRDVREEVLKKYQHKLSSLHA